MFNIKLNTNKAFCQVKQCFIVISPIKFKVKNYNCVKIYTVKFSISSNKLKKKPFYRGKTENLFSESGEFQKLILFKFTKM